MVKQATRGKKQIVEENKDTLRFYRNLSCGASASYVLYVFVWLRLLSIGYTVIFILCLGLYASCYYFMARVSHPKYSDTGSLIDGGIDLNMEGGFAENIKDLMIITAGCQLLSLFSDYFWFLWLLVPIRVGWLFWSYFIMPYISQPTDSPVVVNEKKQRRMERRMNRVAAH